MVKNKNLLIGTAVLVVILILGGVFLVFNKKSAPSQTANIEEQTVETLKPEEIGLTLERSADGNKVIMEISNTEDITAVEYELSYLSTGDIPRGAIGQAMVKSPGQVIRQEITLGTCSDVCHYDKDISDIKLVVKVTKTDGKIYQIEKTLE